VITAVDSSVLLDIILDDPKYREASTEALKAARRQGALVVCPVGWAEVRAALRVPDAIADVLGAAGIAFDPFDQECADRAGDHWNEYRRRGGRRTVLIPDFLVAAHAQVRAARLLSRDRGFLRRHFADLEVIEPQA
jgi:predicted nucleic acid-binding protein